MYRLIHRPISNTELLNLYLQGDLSKKRSIEDRLKRILKRKNEYDTLSKFRSRTANSLRAEYGILNCYRNIITDSGSLVDLFKRYALND